MNKLLLAIFDNETAANSGVNALRDFKASLDSAVHRAQQRIDTLKQEADAKAEALKLQLSQAKSDVKGRIEDRMKRVKSAHHVRSAKLSQACSLTKEALAV